MWAEVAVAAFKLVVVASMLLTIVPVMTWVERRGAAFIQDRLGPNRVGPWGLLQPVADAVKLLFKEDVTPAHVSKGLYFLAPAVAVFVALSTFVVIPFAKAEGVTLFGVPLEGLIVAPDLQIGVLYLLALSSLSVYGIVLAGWASNNKYSLLGGLRSSAQLISYELAMTLAVLGVLLAAGDLQLSTVAEQQAKMWNAVPQALGFLVFLVAAFAETNRLPFDLAEAENELVAGYHVELSSMKFAAFMMSEYINMTTVSALAVTLYLGGWGLPGVNLPDGWLGLGLSLAIFMAKVGLLLWLFVWVRWSLPRFRYDQLMRLGWKGLIPLALLNLAWVSWGLTQGWW
ncbi:MAG: NADH-quinone oxidoreductase subunit NuoH [Thermoanaerobaculum sp.]|nr:NADH-quinone oxidoreductase subunit NuoH [Thermoanaerobaculum sp.]MCX7895677.1 NADH-quinone oxidoreductase subunit NuoH [Thermoanaerobaculum sp.]MDW7968049.1 NADH-quinone oxidoreductase subunit NuoH [Thermoanaerobaculum sp.]